MLKSIYTFGLLAIFLFSSCTKDIVIHESVTFVSYSDEEYDELSEILSLPRYVDRYQGDRPFASDTRATLGRVLFYDKNLSADGSVSCASCHKQDHAFADNVALSKGIYGRQTDRNSLALGVFESFSNHYGSDGNPGESALFWDTRSSNVHSQIVETMANDQEMGMTMSEVVDRFDGARHYEILFEKAYGISSIDDRGVLSALERFMQGMTSSNSKFDRVRESFLQANNGAPNLIYSESESRGFALFKSNCESCHAQTAGGQVIFKGKQFANNGLDASSSDMGRRLVTSLAEDDGVFKVPSLRNIALTAPYMHDGRFKDLEEVIDFYSDGVQAHENLDPFLKDEEGKPKNFNFSATDKRALVDFLETLTDMSELSHEKFSDPWF